MGKDKFNSRELSSVPVGRWASLIGRIGIGEENAVHLSELAALEHVVHSTIKSAVRRLKMAGYPVCSSQMGYFFPKDKTEAEKSLNAHLRATKARFVTVKKIRQELKESSYQMSICDFGLCGTDMDGTNENNLKGKEVNVITRDSK